jgi:glyoxylase I family protein
MIKQVAHICIGAVDLNAARHFYCDILGMEKGFDFIKNDELYGFYVKAGENTYIEIFIQEQEPNYERPIMRHLCLEVDDLDSFIEMVRGKGGEVTNKKQGGDKSWQAWMKDPSGVAIEVMQYTPESSQFTGNPCIVDW